MKQIKLCITFFALIILFIGCLSTPMTKEESAAYNASVEETRQKRIADYPLSDHTEIIQSSFDKDYLFETVRSWLVTHYSNAAGNLNAVIDKSMLSLQVSIPLSVTESNYFYTAEFKGRCTYTIIVEFRENRIKISTIDTTVFLDSIDGNYSNSSGELYSASPMTDTEIPRISQNQNHDVFHLRPVASEKYQEQWKEFSVAMHNIVEGTSGSYNW